MTEAALHRQVAKFLDAALDPGGAFWFHPPNGGARNVVAGSNLKKIGMRRGIPDICIIAAGKAYFIELKTPKGRVSDAQFDCMNHLTTAGAHAWVCRSLDDVQDAVLRWGIPLRGAIT